MPDQPVGQSDTSAHAAVWEYELHRFPIECDCGHPDGPMVHMICSACGDDWDECECGLPIKEGYEDG